MSSPNSPISIASHDDDVHLSPRSTPPQSPRFVPVSSTRTEEVEPSSESEPFEDESSNETKLMEEESESLGSETKELSPTPAVPTNPTPPTRVPSSRPYRLHPEGPLMLFTAKKSVRPIRNDIFNPNTIKSTATVPRRVHARKWGWLRDQVQTWRAEEGVPNHPEVGESSNAISIPPLTQEPVHLTVPVLVARLASHETKIRRLESDQEDSASNEVELLQNKLAEAKEEIAHLTQTVSTMQENWADIRDEATALGQRLEQSEWRANEAEQRAIQMEERMAALEQRVERVDALGSAITQMAESVKQTNQTHG